MSRAESWTPPSGLAVEAARGCGYTAHGQLFSHMRLTITPTSARGPGAPPASHRALVIPSCSPDAAQRCCPTQDREVTVFKVAHPKGGRWGRRWRQRLGQSHPLSVTHVNGDAGAHSSGIF